MDREINHKSAMVGQIFYCYKVTIYIRLCRDTGLYSAQVFTIIMGNEIILLILDHILEIN